MRTILPSKLEDGRVRDGITGTTVLDGAVGMFFIIGPKGTLLKIFSSGADSEFGWEHVSVSTDRRTPNWDEMCFVKDLFWRSDECVVQYHPPQTEYVNFHPYCLHLWKPIGITIPTPPSALVGPKGVGP